MTTRSATQDTFALQLEALGFSSHKHHRRSILPFFFTRGSSERASNFSVIQLLSLSRFTSRPQQVSFNDVGSFSPKRLTKFIIHGFTDTHTNPWISDMARALLVHVRRRNLLYKIIRISSSFRMT